MHLPPPVELILDILELSLPSGDAYGHGITWEQSNRNQAKRVMLLAEYALINHSVYSWARPLLLSFVKLETPFAQVAFVKAFNLATSCRS